MNNFITRIAPVVLAVMLCTTGAFAKKKQPDPVQMAQDSLNRAVAVVMASHIDEVLKDFERANIHVERSAVGRYISDIINGADMGFNRVNANAYIDEAIRAKMPVRADSVSIESQREFIDSIALSPGAITTPSGLVFVVITEGEGLYPKETDKVRLHYTARLSDGTVFDDTEDDEVIFDVDKVVPGFSEGLRLMKPGGVYRVVIPPELGYGSTGIPGIIPGNAALDFFVILDEIIPQ